MDLPRQFDISGPVVPDSLPRAADVETTLGYRPGWWNPPDSTHLEFLHHKAPDAASFFGGSSSINPRLIDSVNTADIVHNSIAWPFALYMLLTLLFYFLAIYRYRSSIGIVLKSALSMSKTIDTMETQSNDMVGFLVLGRLMTTLSLGAIITDIACRGGAVAIEDTYIVMGLALAILIAVLIYRSVFIGAIALMDEDKDKDTYKKLRFINKISTTVTAVIITPVVMIAGLGGYPLMSVLIPLGLLFLYHIGRIFKYFIINGFSILQWFLYLCTVEILPVSFIIALVERNNGMN